MKKRIVAFLVCAAMIGSLLAGCGNGEKGNTSDSTVENVSGTSEQGEKDDSTASGGKQGNHRMDYDQSHQFFLCQRR